VVGKHGPAHHQEYCSDNLCLMSCLICMIFVADLVACRLMSAVAYRPVKTPRLWSGFLVWLL